MRRPTSGLVMPTMVSRAVSLASSLPCALRAEAIAREPGARRHLSEMSRSDTAAYISHRLSVAGNNGGLRFDDAAVDEIYEYSGGTPRLINTVGDKALLAAYVKGASSISGEIVRMAIGDLNGVACEV